MIVDGYGQSADPNALWKRVDLALCPHDVSLNV